MTIDMIITCHYNDDTIFHQYLDNDDDDVAPLNSVRIQSTDQHEL